MESLTYRKFYVLYCDELRVAGIDPDDIIDENDIMKLYISQVVVRKWDAEQARKRRVEKAEKERLTNRAMMKTMEKAFKQMDIPDGGLKDSLESLTKNLFKKDKKLM